MASQIHRRRVGDTRTVLPVQLVQPNVSGVLTPVNLTGLTVYFKMINSADGSDKVVTTVTGIIVDDAATGKVSFDFSEPHVDTAGIFWGTFIVSESGETDAFPVIANELKIYMDSPAKRAEQAYAEATGTTWGQFGGV